MKNLRLRRLLILLALGLPALACNFPGLARVPAPDDQVEALRQTMDAMLAQEQAAATPEATAPAPDTLPGIPPPPQENGPFFTYTAQSGDTLPAVAARFGVSPGEISAPQAIPPAGLIDPGLPLIIPNALPPAAYPHAVMPDSEVVYSPTALDFDTLSFVARAGGYLSRYGETVDGEWLSGAQIVERLAVETSTNPRLLLALLEYRSHWLLGDPRDTAQQQYPLGFYNGDYRGLYPELSLAVRYLSQGYYGWRRGSLTEMEFTDGSRLRLAPGLNAGTAAVQVLFSHLMTPSEWEAALYGSDSFPVLYQRLYGDPWELAAGIGPLLPAGLAQPPLELPFLPGGLWSLTGGPHIAWGEGSPPGALDFAPVTGEPACSVSAAWATAAAAGIVVRSHRNVVVLDLDGDGREQTGWDLLYMHVADQERVLPGATLAVDAPIGHPSCQGGRATGSHVHLARKYNGEWLSAGGPLPFTLSGWVAQESARAYEGILVKGDQIVTARPDGSHQSSISR